jgi:AhpD family alkylhydroperoxidase
MPCATVTHSTITSYSRDESTRSRLLVERWRVVRRLAEHGLSSLGRTESHVLASIDEVIQNSDRVYKEETPDILAAFNAFASAVFADEGREIPLKYTELMALMVSIEAHSQNAVRAGATVGELAEAAWVSKTIRAGGRYTHGRLGFKFGAEEAARQSH